MSSNNVKCYQKIGYSTLNFLRFEDIAYIRKITLPITFSKHTKNDSWIKFYLIYFKQIARYLTACKTSRAFRFSHFISFLRICASIICQLHLPCFLPLGNNRIVILQILLKHEKYFPCVGGKITLNMIYNYTLHKWIL